MHVLVTGATGFVGASLVAVLNERGWRVTAVSRGEAPMLQEVYRREMIDINPGTSWDHLLDDIDTVVHLADGFNAFEHLPASIEDEKASRRGEATLNLGRAAIGNGVPNFVYLSTVKAMCGTWAADVLTEDTGARPTSLYGRLKLETEQKIQNLAKGSRTRLVCLRFPIVFGSNADGNFARLVRLADTPLPLPFAGLESRRSMISLTSLTDAIAAAARIDTGAGGTFLVHDGAVSLPQLITRLRRGVGRPARLFWVAAGLFKPLEKLPRAGPVVQRFTRPLELCDDRFRRKFSWVPPVDMAQELQKAARRYRRSPVPVPSVS